MLPTRTHVLVFILIANSLPSTQASTQCDLDLQSQCTCSEISNKISIKCQYTSGTNANQPIIVQNAKNKIIRIDKVDISSSNLQTVSSVLFEGISSVDSLILRNNSLTSISDIDTSEISDLLSSLDLCGNSITVADFWEVKTRFPSLQMLQLCENRVGSIVRSDESSNVLQELDLSKNSLQSINSDLWRESLSFDFSSNNIRLTGSMKSTLLEKLDLSNNGIINVPDGFFQGMTMLRVLDLSMNEINTLRDETFTAELRNLVELNLSDNKLSSISKDAFIKLNNVKLLDVSNNKDINQIDEMNWPIKLTNLNFVNTGLTELQDCNLFKLSEIREMEIGENKLKCSCHLKWMYETVKSRHGSVYGEWPCIQDDGDVTLIDSWKSTCDDHYPAYLPEHCVDEILGDFRLDGKSDDDLITVSWDINDYSLVESLQIVIKDKENFKFYQSSALERNSSEFTVTLKHDDQFTVCLELYDKHAKFYEKCDLVTGSSLQIVVGILAGVIFLIPCLIALSYIIYTDRQKMKDNYLRLQDEEKKITPASTETTLSGDMLTASGKPVSAQKPVSIETVVPTIIVTDDNTRDIQVSAKADSSTGKDNPGFEGDNKKKVEKTMSSDKNTKL